MNQGKPDEARALADEFKALRGAGQPTPVTAPLGDEAGPAADDPMANVPNQIGDVQLSDDLRKEYLEGSQFLLKSYDFLQYCLYNQTRI